jgi:hypothetical protein
MTDSEQNERKLLFGANPLSTLYRCLGELSH